MKRKNRKRYKKNFVDIFSVTVILGIILGVSINEYEENDVVKNQNKYEAGKTIIEDYENKSTALNEITNNTIKEKLEYPKEEILENYNGYSVCAKLEIPVISLETYVLSEYSIQNLNVSVTKFFGPNPNEIGNFCVAGHNFRNKNMFKNLKKVEIGDEIFLIDNKVGKVKYIVYEIDKVFPNDVSCLEQNSEVREITLITCTSDSKKRIIVKAKENL